MADFKIKDWFKRKKEAFYPAFQRYKPRNFFKETKEKAKTQWIPWIAAHRSLCLKGLAVIGLMVSISVSGHYYVKANVHDIYLVTWEGELVGTVSDPAVVENFIREKNGELKQKYPDIHMVLDTQQIGYQREKVFREQAEDTKTIRKLDERLIPQAIGVRLIVDGKLIGIVKDKETAENILNRIKQKYASNPEDQRVQVLSAASNASSGKTKVESVEFVEKVELKEATQLQPNDILSPEEVLKKLETGDVKERKYVVQEGDCVSCIAHKFDIPIQVIYERNPWIEDDLIRVGDELDLTVYDPALTVKSVETTVEMETIQHDVIYEQDPNLRMGDVKMIKPGKNGLKKLTFKITKMNGYVVGEELIGEEVIEEPVSAVAKRGTKVIRGEGSGRFSWPVIGARLTSSYGMRWGRMHKGIDLASKNRNILAADNGKVVFAGTKSGYGKCVIIDHQNGYRTLYAHLNQISTTSGKIVEKGEKIGVMGATGHAYGIHLHFEIVKNGKTVNPLQYLR